MRSVYEERVAEATQIRGQIQAGHDRIVTRKFGPVARVIWPLKTAFELAAIAGVEERTAKRWLSGEFEPPAIVIAAIIVEITKRE